MFDITSVVILTAYGSFSSYGIAALLVLNGWMNKPPEKQKDILVNWRWERSPSLKKLHMCANFGGERCVQLQQVDEC